MRSVTNNLYDDAATSFFWILWNILYTPFSFLQGISNVVIVLFMNAYELVKDICLFMSSIFRFASSADATVSSYEVSMWRTLSKDLFSQVVDFLIVVVIHGLDNMILS